MNNEVECAKMICIQDGKLSISLTQASFIIIHNLILHSSLG